MVFLRRTITTRLRIAGVMYTAVLSGIPRIYKLPIQVALSARRTRDIGAVLCTLPENASEGVSLSGPVFGPQDRHSAGHSGDMPSSGPKGAPT
jgi:hypothetical protein